MNADTRPSFLKRFFIALVRTIFTLLILAILIVAGVIFLRELQRSFDSVTARVEINRRELEALRSEVNELAAESPTQQQDIESLQSEINELEARMNGQQIEVASDLERQEQLLTSLEDRLEVAVDNNEIAAGQIQGVTEDTVDLSAGINALQADLNDNNSRIDALGGELDEIRSDNESLESHVDELNQSFISAAEAAAEVSDLQLTLSLFHVWELVARARLRLIEDNVGLATADVARAFRAVDALLAEGVGESEESLRVVQTRLAFTFSNLPDNPEIASRDLESAWDELEVLLAERALPELPEDALIGEIELPPATPEAEEPVPELTPTPTPTPSP